MLAHTVLALHLFQATPAVAHPKPGHWQQEARYWIMASLDEGTSVLSGSQSVRYLNDSPDTLTTFSLYLYPYLYPYPYLNAFRPGFTRLGQRAGP
jgi:hypothetical protein